MRFIFTAFFLTVLSVQSNAQKQAVENLIFEGAGIRGIAYSGVIKVLEDEQLMPQIRNVGGTSAGAITALMLSLGYTASEIYTIITETPFQKFNDGKLSIYGGFRRMGKHYGWYRKKAFEQWLSQHIELKTGNPDITFKQLEQQGFKSLYVTGTCLNKQTLIVFSAKSYPNMRVKDAISISMSVPLYFEASFIDSNGSVYTGKHIPTNADIVIDGGITANFPIDIFDSIDIVDNKEIRVANFKTIGVRIDGPSQIELDKEGGSRLSPADIHDFKSYLSALYVFIHEKQNRSTLTKADWDRTIAVSSESIGPRIKKLSLEQKQLLMRSGERAAKLFMSKP